MKIEYFFKPDSFELNWEYIEAIPEFAILKDTKQSQVWHSEGNGTAWDHTVRVVKEAFDICEHECKNDDQYARNFILSALFHDIGKGVTTEFKDGDWHSYNHTIEGEKITRRMLWDNPISDREFICNMVRNHMQPLYLFKKGALYDDVLKLAFKTHIWSIIDLKRCDTYGSLPSDPNITVENIAILDTIKEVAQVFDCDTELYLNNKIRRMLFRKYEPWKIVDESMKREFNILIGLPGSGKDTRIEYMKRAEGKYYTVVCRDDIRVELGFCKPDEKYLGTKEEESKVSSAFDRKLINAIKSGDNIIINNTNLKRKYRKSYEDILRVYNTNGYDYTVNFIYIEAPSLEENKKRREGQIHDEVFTNMISNFEWPSNEEYDTFVCIKQEYSNILGMPLLEEKTYFNID